MVKFWILMVWDGETLATEAVKLIRVDTQAAIPAAARAALTRHPRATITILEAMKAASIPAATPITWEDYV